MSALLLLLAAGLAAGEPSADPEIGSLVKPRLAARTNPEKPGDRAKSYRIVECSVNRHEDVMRRVLDRGLDRDYETAMNLIPATRGCAMGGYVGEEVDTISFSFDTPILRGMTAEAVLKKNRKMAGLPALAMQKVYSREWYARTERPRAVDEMATCVADTNPEGIANLLSTDPETSQENMAVRALAPALAPCLAAGAKLSANMISLRSALAEALYHRAFDPAAPASPAAETGKGR